MAAKSASAARANAAGPGTMKTMKAIRIHRRQVEWQDRFENWSDRAHPRGKLVLAVVGDDGDMSGAP